MNKYLNSALIEAKKAYVKDEVPIGAVIVKDEKIIARAHNLREVKNSSLAHAEILCIEKACKKLKSWRLDGCEMYVTLEPCAMCAGALTQARINKVYIGAKDLKNGCVGSISNILEIKTTHRVKYEYLDIEEVTKCSEIISDFFKDLRKSKKDKKQ
ncbi:MAG: nucleoside deaminase [Clostridia bacterium]